MSCKALGVALKLTFEGANQLTYPQTYLFLGVVAASVTTQARVGGGGGGAAGGGGGAWGRVCVLAFGAAVSPHPLPHPPHPPPQMNYLNKALDLFNTAIVTPVYYVMFTTLTVTASMILLPEPQTTAQLATQGAGFVTIVCGTFLLHTTKDLDLPLATFSQLLSRGYRGSLTAGAPDAAPAGAADEDEEEGGMLELSALKAQTTTLRGGSSRHVGAI